MTYNNAVLVNKLNQSVSYFFKYFNILKKYISVHAYF